MDPEQLSARLRSFTSAFSPGQLVTLAVTFVLVVAVVAGSAMWLQQPTYRLLFADMDSETMGQIVTRLKSMKVSYELDEGGRGIRVPASRVDELRLEFASQMDSAPAGWGLFDQASFGTTEFGEQVKYRRAIEGEMARTIATLSEVASARVHVAMGKDKLFGASRPATASVVLKLRSGRSLPPSAISGITNLVAGGVEGLSPESVVVLDSFGRPLARPRPDDGDPAGAASLDRQQRLERDYASRVVAMLEPIVGSDRVRVNVALTLTRNTMEKTEELFDPNTTAVRSMQTSTETSSSGSVANAATPPGVVPGTAGARSNLPPSPAPTTPAGPTVLPGPSSSRSSETRNVEVSKVTTHTLQPSGEVARLSVAVIVDDNQQIKTENGISSTSRTPRSKEELLKIQNLVSSSVGFNADRGDQITVENISFDEPMAEEVQAPNVLVRYAPQIEESARIGAVLVVALLMFLFVIRPMMGRMTPAPAPPVQIVAGTAQRPRTVAELENEIEAQLDAAASQANGDRRLPVLTKRIAETSQKEPEHVAKVLRSWMTEEAR